MKQQHANQTRRRKHPTHTHIKTWFLTTPTPRHFTSTIKPHHTTQNKHTNKPKGTTPNTHLHLRRGSIPLLGAVTAQLLHTPPRHTLALHALNAHSRGAALLPQPAPLLLLPPALLLHARYPRAGHAPARHPLNVLRRLLPVPPLAQALHAPAGLLAPRHPLDGHRRRLLPRRALRSDAIDAPPGRALPRQRLQRDGALALALRATGGSHAPPCGALPRGTLDGHGAAPLAAAVVAEGVHAPLRGAAARQALDARGGGAAGVGGEDAGDGVGHVVHQVGDDGLCGARHGAGGDGDLVLHARDAAAGGSTAGDALDAGGGFASELLAQAALAALHALQLLDFLGRQQLQRERAGPEASTPTPTPNKPKHNKTKQNKKNETNK